MTTYIEVHDASDIAVQAMHLGGAEPAPRDGFSYYPVLGPAIPTIDWRTRPSVSHAVKWNGGAWEWVDTETIAEKQAQAIVEIDAFADARRMDVVGDAARIKEYERAQLGAEQYRDAGYAGPVPPAVASWAHAKRRESWTPKQAADDILAASARWYAALDGIRAMRLDAKETIRAATTGEEVATTVASFRSTLTAAMQGVQ